MNPPASRPPTSHQPQPPTTPHHWTLQLHSKYSFCFFSLSLHLKKHFPTTVKGRWAGREWVWGGGGWGWMFGGGGVGCSAPPPPPWPAVSLHLALFITRPAASDRKGSGCRGFRVPVSGLLQRDYHVATIH